MDVSGRRQFKCKIFIIRISSGTFVGIYHSLHRAKRRVAAIERTQRAKWIVVIRCLMSVGISCSIRIIILLIETPRSP